MAAFNIAKNSQKKKKNIIRKYVLGICFLKEMLKSVAHLFKIQTHHYYWLSEGWFIQGSESLKFTIQSKKRDVPV